MSVSSSVTHSVRAKAFATIKITCISPKRHLNDIYVLNTGVKFEQWKTETKLIVYFCCKCALSGVDGKTILRENWQSPHKISESSLVHLVTVRLPYIFWIFILFVKKVIWPNWLKSCLWELCVCLFDSLSLSAIVFYFFPWKFCCLPLEFLNGLVAQWLSPWNWIFEQIILAHELRHI